MLVSELPVDLVTDAHAAKGDAEHVVAMRRAQMIEYAGRAAERRSAMMELELLVRCEWYKYRSIYGELREKRQSMGSNCKPQTLNPKP
jgi:hypothetical protein